MNHTVQTAFEEVANAVTHGIGAALSIAGLVLLILVAIEADSAGALLAAAIYGGTLVLLYLSSTLYHGIWHRPTKQVLLLVDHCAIFLLIAGTYTPFALLAMPPRIGLPLLAATWTLAGIGIALKIVAFATLSIERFNGLSVVFYLAMGWIGLFWAGEPLLITLEMEGLIWLLTGGLLYTAGVIFFVWERLPFNHAIWHIFVLSASACHFYSVFAFVLPEAA